VTGGLVDAHLHLWDPSTLDYPWLIDLPDLHRPFGVPELTATVTPPDAAVFVEAGGQGEHPLSEVEFVERVAAGWPALRGIVAYAPLERGAAVGPHLRALAARPLVRGVRRNIQDETPGFALSDDFLAGVRGLAEHGLVADVCVRDHQLEEVIGLVGAVPEVTFVLDHLGKPAIRDGRWQPWADQLARLAERPNVVCKLSGLTTEARWDSWTPDEIRPYLAHALSRFGPDRCLFGGDWPVSTLAVTYPIWLDLVRDALAPYPELDRAMVLGGTAARVYRLDLPPPPSRRPGQASRDQLQA
jgi:L-fuconolactonase